MFLCRLSKKSCENDKQIRILKGSGSHDEYYFEGNAIKSVLSKLSPMVLSVMPLFGAFKVKPPKIRTHVCSAD
jgi:hypothetical protein